MSLDIKNFNLKLLENLFTLFYVTSICRLPIATYIIFRVWTKYIAIVLDVFPASTYAWKIEIHVFFAIFIVREEHPITAVMYSNCDAVGVVAILSTFCLMVCPLRATYVVSFARNVITRYAAFDGVFAFRVSTLTIVSSYVSVRRGRRIGRCWNEIKNILKVLVLRISTLQRQFNLHR